MLKRPSSRRKSTNQGITLNLVPILDAMVTLIGFLLFTMSFLAIVGIESPFPQASQKDVEDKLKEKPLQLTLSIHKNNSEIWSPFGKLSPKIIPHAAPGVPNIKDIHEALVDVKKFFPKESKIVLVPSATTNYDTLISVMDSLRMLEPSDPPIYVHNQATGNDELLKSLFPEVIFGNLLGES